jgi:hypothetical protein
MVIRSLLQDAYAQQDGSAGAGAPAPDASAGAPPAPDAASGAMKAETEGKKDESMDKAEKAKLESLEKSNSEMKSQIELLTKAIEAGFRPQRKSIEGIEYVRKSEADQGGSAEPSNLSKAEITEKVKSLDYSKLSKNDRNMIDEFILNNDVKAKAHVEKLIGGK